LVVDGAKLMLQRDIDSIHLSLSPLAFAARSPRR